MEINAAPRYIILRMEMQFEERHIQKTNFHDSDLLSLSHFQTIHRLLDDVLHALMKSPAAAAAAGLEYCWPLRAVVVLAV